MKKNLVLILLIVSSISNADQNVGTNLTQPFDPAHTYVFIAGVLQWKSPKLASFSKVNRKDEELYNLLLKIGVSKSNMIYLKDNQATISEMNSKLLALLQRADPQSTFIFYYAGHGARGIDKSVSFANYDYESGSGKGFAVANLSNVINSTFRGKQIWLMADCCYSGSLLQEARESSSNRNVVALTSATASNISTGNWTFTQTLIDCLEGLPEYDKNLDGKITLAEVKMELSEAMLYRERQMSGTAFFNTDENTVVSMAMRNNKPNSPGQYRVGQYVFVLQGLNYQPGRIISTDRVNITCELYNYSDKARVLVGTDDVKPITFIEYPVGKKLQVEWQGKWYAAEVLQCRNGFHYIHYVGEDDTWNEWVMYDRILNNDRKKCTVEWRGTWYPAETIQMKGGKYFVRYTGYGIDWDEWVGADRIKF